MLDTYCEAKSSSVQICILINMKVFLIPLIWFCWLPVSKGLLITFGPDQRYFQDFVIGERDCSQLPDLAADDEVTKIPIKLKILSLEINYKVIPGLLYSS